MHSWTVMRGDACSLPLADSSVDSIVCDPPYGLEFMGKTWDAPWKYGITEFGFADNKFRKPAPQFQSARNPMCRGCRKHKRGSKSHERCACENPDYDETDHRLSDMAKLQSWHYSWAVECLRVLKPGGHLLAFGGSRTYHRLACAIEDAGFEIRDQIQWIYGSGFPKSLDASRAIDGYLGVEPKVVGEKPVVPGVAFEQSTPYATGRTSISVTTGASWAAKHWNGWGTALKPAHEPIVLARKPIVGTIAENLLIHGTGGLNIDGCRIDTNGEVIEPVYGGRKGPKVGGKYGNSGDYISNVSPLGRWPANVIHDGSAEVLAGFPDVSVKPFTCHNSDPLYAGGIAHRSAGGFSDSGSAARFFYCAKASQEDRNEGCEDLPHRVADDVHKRPRTELDDPRRHGVTPRQNNHPTVKPTELMRYLCRLVTPSGGLVLDPFMGSGSTGKAAMLEGFKFVGIELNADYCQLAQRRIEAVTRQGLLFA